MACWHHLKVGSYRTSGPSWDIAEGQWWREIFPVGRTSSRAPVVHFAWKEQVPEVQVYTDWWAVAKIWLNGQRLQRNVTGKLVTVRGWEEIFGWTCWKGKDCEHICVPCECSWKSDLCAWRIPGMGEPGELPSMGSHRVRHDWSDLAVENDFNNQVDRMTYQWIPVGLFSNSCYCSVNSWTKWGWWQG